MSKGAAAKVLDEKDEAFIAFCSFQILDRDGIGLRTKGSSISAPVHLVSTAGSDTVILEAEFDANDPLFYLTIRNEEDFYLFGQVWMDSAKCNEDKALCTIVPISTQAICKDMERSGSSNFAAKARCAFLKDAGKRAFTVTGATAEKKFQTKLAGIRIEISRDAWMEFKNYRVRFWQMGKNYGGAPEEKKDDKDKEDGEEGGDKDKPEKDDA